MLTVSSRLSASDDSEKFVLPSLVPDIRPKYTISDWSPSCLIEKEKVTSDLLVFMSWNSNVNAFDALGLVKFKIDVETR